MTRTRRLLVASSTVPLLALVIGCSASPASAPGPAPGSSGAASSSTAVSTPSTPAAPPTPAVQVLVRGAAGRIALSAATPPGGDPLHAEALSDGNSRLSLTGTSVRIVLRASDTIQVEPDGSAVARTASGDFLLAATAPSVHVAGTPPTAGRWVVRGQHLSAVTSDGQRLTRPQTVRVESMVGATLVSSVSTGSWQGKPRWMVRPSELGRKAPLSLLTTEGWTQARTAGKIPDTDSLRNQFICHPSSGVARSKPSWNIEAARNASNLWDTMAAGCNP